MKLTSGYDRNFLCHMGEKWMVFYHGSNKDAIRLHADGWLERRHLKRAEGGFEYRITDAGRSALQADEVVK